MTVKELIDKLKLMDGEQYIYVRVHHKDESMESLHLQYVEEVKPWFPRDGLLNLVALEVHSSNIEM